MSEYKLSSTLEISVEEARKIIKDFFSKVPKVEAFLTNIGKLGRKNKAIRSGQPYGRVRFFDDPGEDFKRLGEIERASKNMPPQGSNADLTKLALILVYRAINERNIKIVHCIHDEIITECREDIAEEWSKEMSVIMKQAAEVVLTDIPMKVDCSVTDYWKK